MTRGKRPIVRDCAQEQQEPASPSCKIFFGLMGALASNDPECSISTFETALTAARLAHHCQTLSPLCTNANPLTSLRQIAMLQESSRREALPEGSEYLLGNLPPVQYGIVHPSVLGIHLRHAG